MNLRSAIRSPFFLVAVLALAGCSRSTPTEPWPPITDPVVFADGFGAHVGFQAFSGSKLDALSVDSTESHGGSSSLKFTIPAPGPSALYAGGAFVTTQARSLTQYNALSFWVKASRAASLEVAGLGNDNTGTSLYEAKRTAIPVTTSWTQVLIAIPLSAKLEAEKGMFFLAEGPQAGGALTLWVDDVEFVTHPGITNPRPALAPRTVNAIAGTTVSLQGTTSTVFTVAGLDQTVAHLPGYFTFSSSDPTVAEIRNGAVRVLGWGTATISAKLGDLDAAGAITVNASAPPSAPAPTPTLPAGDVVALFSGPYANVPVTTWSADWDQADVADLTIAGNPTKVYSNLVYAGIEFAVIDATALSAFHVDVWAPSGTNFKVKLVDFGADGVYGGGNDSQSELTFDAASTPAFAAGSWVGLDIPLASFAGLASRSHLAQLILSSGDARTAFVDNIYFHR